MDFYHFLDSVPVNGVLPVEAEIYAIPFDSIGEGPANVPPRFALESRGFDDNLFAIPVVFVGGGPANEPPR